MPVTPKEKTRCFWSGTNPLMVAYHDEEWGLPQHDPQMLWEMLMLEGFQAGLSWSTVLNKRKAFRKAFANFVPEKVAKFTETDVERLMKDEGIIRARLKIKATINGARVFCEMKKAGIDFDEFCWSFTKGKVLRGDGVTVPTQTELSTHISKELKKRGFKFVGPTIVYAWMQAVGIVDDHAKVCFRR